MWYFLLQNQYNEIIRKVTLTLMDLVYSFEYWFIKPENPFNKQ